MNVIGGIVLSSRKDGRKKFLVRCRIIYFLNNNVYNAKNYYQNKHPYSGRRHLL